MKKTEKIEYIRRNYGFRTRAALCRTLGISGSEFDWIVKQHGIRAGDNEADPAAPHVDLCRLVKVVISEKLTVYVKPGRDPEQIRRKYAHYA